MGEAWWKTLSSLLDIQTYLSKYLQADRRLQDAEKELATARKSLREATQKPEGEADVSTLERSSQLNVDFVHSFDCRRCTLHHVT